MESFRKCRDQHVGHRTLHDLALSPPELMPMPEAMSQQRVRRTPALGGSDPRRSQKCFRRHVIAREGGAEFHKGHGTDDETIAEMRLQARGGGGFKDRIAGHQIHDHRGIDHLRHLSPPRLPATLSWFLRWFSTGCRGLLTGSGDHLSILVQAGDWRSGGHFRDFQFHAEPFGNCRSRSATTVATSSSTATVAVIALMRTSVAFGHRQFNHCHILRRKGRSRGMPRTRGIASLPRRPPPHVGGYRSPVADAAVGVEDALGDLLLEGVFLDGFFVDGDADAGAGVGADEAAFFSTVKPSSTTSCRQGRRRGRSRK